MQIVIRAEGLEEFEVQLRKLKFVDFWRLLKVRDSMMMQRSRSKWLKEGDANSKYFHNNVKRRTSVNAIKAIKVGESGFNPRWRCVER